MAKQYNIYKKALNLTESDIRFAMSNTSSNRAAARFIGCDYNTYRVYAERYVDSTSGKTLWELHSNQGGFGSKKKSRGKKLDRISILEVLEGKHPDFPKEKLKAKVLQNGLMVEECSQCGFSERRITDGSVPLLMIWKDGNFQNHLLDNLQLWCFNCYFLMYGEIFRNGEFLDKKCEGYYEN